MSSAYASDFYICRPLGLPFQTQDSSILGIDFPQSWRLRLIGQTISHYKITSKLDEGGMGEVYRAEDTTLRREVAIKVVPEQFTQDAERLARFQHEAQVLASLNHPNIAAIHSFEHSDGVHFLAMELVEGETLAERVAKGPLPVEEALEVSHQIAEGPGSCP